MGGLCGRDDVVFGATVSGRPGGLGGVESMVGLFINTVPELCRCGAGVSVAGLLVDLQERSAGLLDHQHWGLAEIHRGVGGGGVCLIRVVVFES